MRPLLTRYLFPGRREAQCEKSASLQRSLSVRYNVAPPLPHKTELPRAMRRRLAARPRTAARGHHVTPGWIREDYLRGASGGLRVPLSASRMPTGVRARCAHGFQTRLWAMSDRTGDLNCESDTLPIWKNTVERSSPVRGKTQQLSYWRPIWDRFRSTSKPAGQVPQHVLSTWYIFATMLKHKIMSHDQSEASSCVFMVGRWSRGT